MQHLFIIMLIAATAAFSQDKRINIAVSDLAGQGIDQPAAATISERLRVELIGTQSFRVMERAQMATILQEQGFQQTGCVDNSCIVEMGQLLGVENMVMGTIGMVCSMYTISLRMVNVATSEVLYTASEDCSCPIEAVLTTSTKNIATKLALAIEKAVYGTLKVTTVPESAEVLINNSKVGSTPYFNDRFVPGKYHLAINKGTFQPIAQEIIAERSKVVDLSFELGHTKQYLDSVKVTTRKARIRNLVIRQVILGALVIGCGGGGYYYNNKLQSSVDEKEAAYNTYRDAGENGNFNALWDNYQDAGKDIGKQQALRNVLYGCAAAFTVGFGVSFVF